MASTRNDFARAFSQATPATVASASDFGENTPFKTTPFEQLEPFSSYQIIVSGVFPFQLKELLETFADEQGDMVLSTSVISREKPNIMFGKNILIVFKIKSGKAILDSLHEDMLSGFHKDNIDELRTTRANKRIPPLEEILDRTGIGNRTPWNELLLDSAEIEVEGILFLSDGSAVENDPGYIETLAIAQQHKVPVKLFNITDPITLLEPGTEISILGLPPADNIIALSI